MEIDALIFGKESCRYCKLAVALLEKEGISHHYVDVEKDPVEKEYMVQQVYEASGSWPSTVPQIFLEGEYVGGYDDLCEALKKAEVVPSDYFDIGEL